MFANDIGSRICSMRIRVDKSVVVTVDVTVY